MIKVDLSDTIISVTDFLEDFSVSKILEGVALRLKQRRLELNLTQELLAKKSGVSLGTLKRFENKHEISLKSLAKLAICLGETESLKKVFRQQRFKNIYEVIDTNQAKRRKRGRINV
jgi:transcriptional regulator with XRE-family HTH domain